MQSTPPVVVEAFNHVTRSLSAVGYSEKSKFSGSQQKIAFQNSFSDIRACVDEDHVIRLKDSEYFFLEL